MTQKERLETIRMLCMEISLKHKNSFNKKSKELQKLKRFISETDIFKGRKRKAFKIIKRFMLKKK